METYTLKNLKKQDIDVIHDILIKIALTEKKINYAYWQLKLDGAVVTAYHSGKILIQGKKTGEILKLINSENPVDIKLSDRYPMGGSDEVGCGDYFGPVVVAACVVPNEKIAMKLKELGVDDSKNLSDRKVQELAPLIKELCKVKIAKIYPEKYNKIHETKDMITIKCMLHELAWENLAQKTDLPPRKYIDQFCPENIFYDKLGMYNTKKYIFETKADSKYLPVMCASIIARDTFLKDMSKMEEEWCCLFPKGANAEVDVAGMKFVQEHSVRELQYVAKIHFANTERITKDLKRKKFL